MLDRGNHSRPGRRSAGARHLRLCRPLDAPPEPGIQTARIWGWVIGLVIVVSILGLLYLLTPTATGVPHTVADKIVGHFAAEPATPPTPATPQAAAAH